MTATQPACPAQPPGEPFPGAHREGSGSPVVLLHGASMSWRAWKPVLPFLSGRHDVFVPTLAGHRGGPTLPPGAAPGVTAIVDVLCDQLDAAGIENAHLVGNSLGGWAAFELARRGRARSIVAISPAGTWSARRDLLRLLWFFRVGHLAISSPRLSGLTRNPVLRRAAMSRTMAHPERVPADEMAEMIADLEQCDMLTALLDGEGQLRQLTDFDVALCPVKIAWADRDRIIPFNRYGRPMRDVVRGAEFVMLPAVGHVPMYDDPRMIARTILEVTTSVDAAYEVANPRRRRRRSA
ncbi:MAG TPA: alpha/beta fold hydrolase [Pseudonocardia sp.]